MKRRPTLARALALPAVAALAGCAGPSPASDGAAAHGPSATPADWPGTEPVFREGRWWFAGQPGGAGLVRAAEEGVVLVVNLRTPEEMAKAVPFDEPARVEALGMRYVHIPVTPEGFSRETVERFAEAVEGVEGPILVHCSTSNRVGGMWAAYLHIEEGVPRGEALRRGHAAGLAKPAMIEATKGVLDGGG